MKSKLRQRLESDLASSRYRPRHPQIKLPNGITCDEKIGRLVMALSNIPGLRTVSSCQEQEFDGNWLWASVCCEYEDRPRGSLLIISRRIASLLAKRGLTYEVLINWWGSDVMHYLSVRVLPSEISEATEAISRAFNQSKRKRKP